MKNQSPIDLESSGHLKYTYENDKFNKIYQDQKTNITIDWNGHTSQVAINKTDQQHQYFDSMAS